MTRTPIENLILTSIINQIYAIIRSIWREDDKEQIEQPIVSKLGTKPPENKWEKISRTVQTNC